MNEEEEELSIKRGEKVMSAHSEFAFAFAFGWQQCFTHSWHDSYFDDVYDICERKIPRSQRGFAGRSYKDAFPALLTQKKRRHFRAQEEEAA
jgi:hypothetical protein